MDLSPSQGQPSGVTVPDRGWRRNRANDSEDHQLVRLRRDSTTAEEGVFTCNIPGDDNTPRYLGVYYPSEVSDNIKAGAVSHFAITNIQYTCS